MCVNFFQMGCSEQSNKIHDVITFGVLLALLEKWFVVSVALP